MEGHIFEGLREFAVEREGTTVRLLELPWMQGPINDAEVGTLNTLGIISSGDEELGDKFVALPWIQDGISEDELTAIYGLAPISLDWPVDGPPSINVESTKKILDLPWMQDDVTETEGDLIQTLKSVINFYTREATEEIITMPFMHRPNRTDRIVIGALNILITREMIRELLELAEFQNGVTDELAVRTASIAFVGEEREIRRMMDPSYAETETLSRGTEPTPKLRIHIVRTETRSDPRTIEGAWKAAEFTERTMQIPLPVEDVIILLNKAAVRSGRQGTAGFNSGSHIAYTPQEEHVDTARESLLLGLAHETAHYYWGGESGGKTEWVNEGIAETIKYMYGVETGLLERIPQRAPRGNCEADDLESLEKQGTGVTDHCPYYLGASLFIELREELGTDEFNRRIQELHHVYEVARNVGVYPTAEAYKYTDIHGVRQVFHDQLEIVERHWSGRMNAPENRP